MNDDLDRLYDTIILFCFVCILASIGIYISVPITGIFLEIVLLVVGTIVFGEVFFLLDKEKPTTENIMEFTLSRKIAFLFGGLMVFMILRGFCAGVMFIFNIISEHVGGTIEAIKACIGLASMLGIVILLGYFYILLNSLKYRRKAK